MLIVLIAVIAAIMCFVTIKRYRDTKKANEVSHVEKYRDNYINRRKDMQTRRETASRTRNYVTKYNSSEDYREK